MSPVELANISTRGQALLQASSSSLALVGNARNEMHNAQIDSQQDSSVPAASISIFKNVPRRAGNNYLPL